MEAGSPFAIRLTTGKYLGVTATSSVVPGAIAGKPSLRGVTHLVAFVAFLGLGPAIVAHASRSQRPAIAVYAVAVTALFGVSALLHMRMWGPAARRWLRRLDHGMIFLVIAGTYTPAVGLTLDETPATVVLSAVWIGALIGIALNLAWFAAPKPVVFIPYVVVGWAAVGVTPQLYDALGASGFWLILIGGLLYTAGGAVYAMRRPNPAPATFGYHEVFHALVVAAALTHYAAIWLYVLD